MSNKGAPTPVAWTRLRAPQGSMDPTPADQMLAAVSSSPLLPECGVPVDPKSAADHLGAQEPAATAAADKAKDSERVQKEAEQLRKQAPRPTGTRARSAPRAETVRPSFSPRGRKPGHLPLSLRHGLRRMNP